MKKTMGIALIVVGVILAVVGIVMVSGGNSGTGASVEETAVSVAEMKAKRQVSNTQPNQYNHSSKARKDENPSSHGGSGSIFSDIDIDKKEVDSKPTGTVAIDDKAQRTVVATQDKAENMETKAKSSKEKGDEFEDFTVNILADWRMKLLRRTQDKMSSGGVVAESCKEPDLHIEQKRGNSKVDYHLECKYRSRWTNNAVTFEEWQINRYKEFQKAQKRKVLIALGVGGSPSRPQTFMIVPLDSIKDNTIRKVDVSKYAVTPTPDGLVEYIDHYFDEVFVSSRRKKKEN